MPHLVDFAKTHKYDFVTLSGDQVNNLGGGIRAVDGVMYQARGRQECSKPSCICLISMVAINNRRMTWPISMVSKVMNT